MFVEIIKHLIITEFFEITCAYVIGIRGKKNIYIIFIVNVSTNVLLNLILKLVIIKQCLYLSADVGIDYFVLYYIFVVIFETVIVFLEAIIYNKNMKLGDKCLFYKNKTNYYTFLIISFILNIASIIGGRLID